MDSQLSPLPVVTPAQIEELRTRVRAHLAARLKAQQPAVPPFDPAALREIEALLEATEEDPLEWA